MNKTLQEHQQLFTFFTFFREQYLSLLEKQKEQSVSIQQQNCLLDRLAEIKPLTVSHIKTLKVGRRLSLAERDGKTLADW